MLNTCTYRVTCINTCLIHVLIELHVWRWQHLAVAILIHVLIELDVLRWQHLAVAILIHVLIELHVLRWQHLAVATLPLEILSPTRTQPAHLQLEHTLASLDVHSCCISNVRCSTTHTLPNSDDVSGSTIQRQQERSNSSTVQLQQDHAQYHCAV